MGWSFKAMASLAAFGCCILSMRTGRAQEALPPNWLSTQVNERGLHCAPLSQQVRDDKLLLACGVSGVWEIALGTTGPKFVRSYSFSGDAIGFISDADGRLWVKLQVLEARPLWTVGGHGAAVFPDLAPAVPEATPTGQEALPAAVAPKVTQAPVAALPAPRKQGRVERSAAGEVVISLGTSDGVARGDHIEFALPSKGVESGEEAALSTETLAVGVVSNVSARSARVRLGLNESVPTGAFASVTSAISSASLTAPPRAQGLWELELMARPFAALDELGGGVLMSGSFGYRYTHLHLQAVFDPLAFAAVETTGSVAVANAGAIASYDSHYFELGLGLGFQTVNETSFAVQPGSGLSVVELVRLGPRDGLNLTARANLVLFHSQFQFGGMVASGQIPLTRGYWLLLNGGGGNLGYGFGELGLRSLLAGNGLAGSKYLTVTVGGVGVFKSGSCDEFFSCSQEKSYGGLQVGVGGEWRF